jgi:hypothetical protein
LQSTALLVVKRIWFDQFATGKKTIEYRRHRGQFTARTFYPGRAVRIAYRYDWQRFPSLAAEVVAFRVIRARDAPDQSDCYADILPDDEIAEIFLRIIGPG